MTTYTLWTVFTWTFNGILCTCRFLWVCPYNAIKFLPKEKLSMGEKKEENKRFQGNEFTKIPGSPDRIAGLHKRLIKTERDILTLKSRFACERSLWERRFAELRRQQERLCQRLISKTGGLLEVGSCDEQEESGNVFDGNSSEFHHHRGLDGALHPNSQASTLSGSWLTSSSSSVSSSSSSVLGSRTSSCLSSASRSSRYPRRVFVPHSPLDLQLGHRVRVLLPSGRISTGTVRFLGVLQGEPELQLGVELLIPEGGSQDGSHKGQLYFKCKPGHGAFVPFHKLVMAWE